MSDEDEGVTRVRPALNEEFAYEPAAAAVVSSLERAKPAPLAFAPAADAGESGPLPPPPRKYQRPSAYWADRWITVSKP